MEAILLNSMFQSYQSYWKTKYALLVKNREKIWYHLKMYDLSPEQFNRRPKPHLWSIDEVLRHMLASEVMYIHQKIDHSIDHPEFGVGAQWVGEYILKTGESTHYTLTDIEEIAGEITEKTKQLLNSVNEPVFEKTVKAPWGEEMSFNTLLENFYYHEAYHCGQVHYLMNLIGDSLQIERFAFSPPK